MKEKENAAVDFINLYVKTIMKVLVSVDIEYINIHFRSRKEVANYTIST